MVRIYAIQVEDFIEDKDYETLLTFVSKEKREKIKRYHFVKDKVRSLIGDVLIRYGLHEIYGLNHELIKFHKNDYGKPSLIGVKDIHFNISHAGNWVVCAFHEDPVGIDVEQIKDIEMNIANRFFSQGEIQDLHLLNSEEQKTYFFQLWTMKEAYIKAEGKGLSIPLDSFCIRRKMDGFTVEPDNNWYMHAYDLDEGYCMAVASKSSVGPENPRIFQMNPFIKKVLEQRPLSSQ